MLDNVSLTVQQIQSTETQPTSARSVLIIAQAVTLPKLIAHLVLIHTHAIQHLMHLSQVVLPFAQWGSSLSMASAHSVISVVLSVQAITTVQCVD
jgi:hypothetical protein